MPRAVEPAIEPAFAMREVSGTIPDEMFAETPSTKNEFDSGRWPLTLNSPWVCDPFWVAACGLWVTIPGVNKTRSCRVLPFKGMVEINLRSTTVLTDASLLFSVRLLASTFTVSVTAPTFIRISRFLVSPVLRVSPFTCVVAKPSHSICRV